MKSLIKRIAGLLLVLLLAACATTVPTAVTPSGEDRYLVDPRIGYDHTADPSTSKRFDAAWALFLSNQYAEARTRLVDLRKRAPAYAPVRLALAAIDLREGKLEQASKIIAEIEDATPKYLAVQIYSAELAMARQDARGAWERYRLIAAEPGAPAEAGERLAQLRKTLFDQTYAEALNAKDADAVRLLREALTLQGDATNARVLLVQKLVALQNYDEARRELDPLLNGAAVDQNEVQESLAEIDAGRGRYQEAIVRYERLVRRDNRFSPRLEQIKQKFAAANMPMQYQRAFEADAIDRADFAVLLYWKVAAVRFAQNLSAPPIAIDIGEVPGREELIRAIALGVFSVDPVTRRVGPNSPVSSATLVRLAARVLNSRGASCSAKVPYDSSELVRAQRALSACGIADPTATVSGDVPATGRAAATLLDEVDRALAR